MQKEYFKNLTKEEKYILKDKGTEPPFRENIMIFMMQVYLFAVHARHRYMNQIQNLIQVVVGHLSMTK